MRLPDASALLDALERGLDRPRSDRALLLLQASNPEIDRGVLHRFSVGETDSRLLSLRRLLFGPQFSALTDCPQCGDRLDLEFSLDEPIPTESPGEDGAILTAGGWTLRYRLPSLADLDVASQAVDREQALAILIKSAVLEAVGPEGPVSPERIPAEMIDALENALQRADPLAITDIRVDCPACGHEWQVSFDILAYFWSELESWANRLLNEIHTLASAYGWSESEILALPSRRRECYLKRILQ